VLLARQLLETMEERVDEDDVRVQRVDSGRKNEVEPESADQAIPGTAERIQEKPSDKLQEMGTGHGRNFVPEDCSGVLRESNPWLTKRLAKREILNALGVEMNFAMVLAGEAFEKLGKGALGAMAAVHEG
jgi:hypothetical protein